LLTLFFPPALPKHLLSLKTVHYLSLQFPDWVLSPAGQQAVTMQRMNSLLVCLVLLLPGAVPAKTLVLQDNLKGGGGSCYAALADPAIVTILIPGDWSEPFPPLSSLMLSRNVTIRSTSGPYYQVDFGELFYRIKIAPGVTLTISHVVIVKPLKPEYMLYSPGAAVEIQVCMSPKNVVSAPSQLPIFHLCLSSNTGLRYLAQCFHRRRADGR
jgi:hypothetical protein